MYHKDSSYIDKDGNYIGKGLFCNVGISCGTSIGNFNGSFINLNEKQAREDINHGGYFIQFNTDIYLDCYAERQDKTCKLSFANSYVRARSTIDGEVAKENCKLVLNYHKRIASLKTITFIKPHEELFYNYGNNYTNVNLAPIHFTGDSLPDLSL